MRIEPVDPDRWDDLERLFGPNGAYSNCWCTWWTWTAKDWDARQPHERRAELRRQVDDGWQPGLLAYDGDEPIGWCAVAPRPRYARFMSTRSPTYRPIDDRPSWVVSCFFVRRDRRGEGVASALLDAATRFVAARGGTLLEGYPVEPGAHTAASGLYTGTVAMFADRGFREAARMRGRPVVRLELPRRRTDRAR